MEPLSLMMLRLIIILMNFYCLINHLIISERRQLDGYSMCFVTAVEHPGHFWIQKIPCSQDYSVDPLDLLIKEMNEFYNSHFSDVGLLFHFKYFILYVRLKIDLNHIFQKVLILCFVAGFKSNE